MSKKSNNKNIPVALTPKVEPNTKPLTIRIWQNKPLLLCLAAILLTTFIAFIPSLGNEFTNWDDDLYVVDNIFIQELSIENFKIWCTQPFVANYQPITMLSYAINYAISGLNPWGYHFTNLLFHLANTILVFFWAYYVAKKNYIVGLIVALLFAVHPLRVESVAWIAERKDVLYTFFLIPSLILYNKYLEKLENKYLITCFILFVLSVLSKPAAVVLPILLLLSDFYFYRTWNIKIILEKIPFFIISLLMGVFTLKAQEEAIGDSYNLFNQLLFACYGFMMYFVKLLFPINLSANYPYPDIKNLPATYYLGFLFVVLVISLCIYSLKKGNRTFTFGVLFYLINLALVLQLVSVGTAIIAERYSYVPHIGILFLIGILCNQLIENPRYSFKNAKQVVGITVITIALLFSGLTFARCKVWKNSEVLWSDVINKYKNIPVAYNNRGNYYRVNKQLDKALADYNQAITLKSDYELAYNNRGNVHFNKGEFKEAIEDYNIVLKSKPNDWKALNNRGAAYFSLNQIDTGLEDVNKAIEKNPLYTDARLNRAVIYSVKNNHVGALEDYNTYLKYIKTNDQAYNWRSISNRLLKNLDASLKDSNAAIKLNNRVADYYLNRSYTYKELGNKINALQDAQQAQQMGAKVPVEYINSLN